MEDTQWPVMGTMRWARGIVHAAQTRIDLRDVPMVLAEEDMCRGFAKQWLTEGKSESEVSMAVGLRFGDGRRADLIASFVWSYMHQSYLLDRPTVHIHQGGTTQTYCGEPLRLDAKVTNVSWEQADQSTCAVCSGFFA